MERNIPTGKRTYVHLGDNKLNPKEQIQTAPANTNIQTGELRERKFTIWR
jgi:hypothetical protein